MIQFIVATFIALAAAFWLLSGGSDFEPEKRPEPQTPAIVEQEAPDVARGAAPTPLVSSASQTQETSAPEPTEEPAQVVTQQTADQDRPEQAQTSTASFSQPVISDTPAPETGLQAPDTAAADAPETNADALWSVDASRVNMRSGPSTDYRVVETLTRGTQVELLSIDELGSEPWGELRVIESGLTGFMAMRFLSQ